MNSQDHGYNKYSTYDNDGLPKQDYSKYSNTSGYSFDAANNTGNYSAHDAGQYSPAQHNNYGYQGQGMQQNIQYGDPQLPYPGYKQKSMLLSAILAFFLGTLGVHNFYLGNKQKGIIQLVMLVMGYATAIILIGIPVLLALHLWVFVEFILILTRSGGYGTDNNGVPLD
ncbi:TM2 domain-containing protein [Corynebacterium pseudodiphtheriticum]|uniref:TM2 domain-containing protein n=1 Tax=Corynebacterium pseudodiphtheriticum TaxID=37637 RepID=UPI002542FEB7|nr:TM2 domain-containing protein [Corynebacterium pseudodiphtheriticum]MDK4240180.1 TM2 domain-containing protein [Corynebacterium pseudodiphtheriticum]